MALAPMPEHFFMEVLITMVGRLIIKGVRIKSWPIWKTLGLCKGHMLVLNAILKQKITKLRFWAVVPKGPMSCRITKESQCLPVCPSVCLIVYLFICPSPLFSCLQAASHFKDPLETAALL